MTALIEGPRPTDRRVRVWFGEHVIADYTAEPATAIQYQAAMTRRFASLRITIEPVTAAVDKDAADS
jgi:hypothetical protein